MFEYNSISQTLRQWEDLKPTILDYKAYYKDVHKLNNEFDEEQFAMEYSNNLSKWRKTGNYDFKLKIKILLVQVFCFANNNFVSNSILF